MASEPRMLLKTISRARGGFESLRAPRSEARTFAAANRTYGSSAARWAPAQDQDTGAGGDLHGCYAGVPGPGGRVAGRAAVTLAVAVQMDPGDPALHRAGLLLAGLRRAQRGGDGGDRGHRPLPAGDLRVQRGRAAVDLAGAVLRDRRVRHRPVPA